MIQKRLGDERGVALPVAVAILLIVLMVSGVAVAYSVRSIDRSNYDRNTTRALGAADAGLDVARYRMNKALVAGQVVGAIGLVTNLTESLGCASLGVGALGLVEIAVEDQGRPWCSPGGWELLDGDGRSRLTEEQACSAGASAAFRYFVRLGVGVSVNEAGQLNDDPLAWDVISVGCANGRQAVVRGSFPISLTGSLDEGVSLRLFKLDTYKQCRGLEFDPAVPDAGCPEVN